MPSPNNLFYFLMANEEAIQAALAEAALSDAPNYRAIARSHNISKDTLRRRHQGLQRPAKQYHEDTQFLSPSQSTVLVSHIERLTELGIPPTPSMVRIFAQEISGKYPGEN
jgi:hypothetical protein